MNSVPIRVVLMASGTPPLLEVEAGGDRAGGSAGGVGERDRDPAVQRGAAAGPVPGVDAEAVAPTREAAQRQPRRQSTGQPVLPGGDAQALKGEAVEARVAGARGEDHRLQRRWIVLRSAQGPFEPGPGVTVLVEQTPGDCGRR